VSCWAVSSGAVQRGLVVGTFRGVRSCRDKNFGGGCGSRVVEIALVASENPRGW